MPGNISGEVAITGGQGMFTKLLELNRIIEGKTPRTKLERLNQEGCIEHNN